MKLLSGPAMQWSLGCDPQVGTVLVIANAVVPSSGEQHECARQTARLWVRSEPARSNLDPPGRLVLIVVAGGGNGSSCRAAERGRPLRRLLPLLLATQRREIEEVVDEPQVVYTAGVT